MNINPTIISALAFLGIPVEPDNYDGALTEYVTFNYADERPSFRANDADVLDETVVQVHYITKGNPQANKKAIRKALRAAGFTIQSTSQIYDTDKTSNHVIVYAWIEGTIND